MSWGPQGEGTALTGRRSTLPPIGDLVEDLQNGMSLDDIATTYGVTARTVEQKVNNAGYSAVTGEPVTRRRETDIPPPALVVPGAWVDDALCAQVDPEIFFPEKGGSTREAKQTCARCPVAAQCLDYALANGESYGLWGGTSERERRALTGRTRLVTCVECGTRFEVARSDNRRYCSDGCRTAARRRHDNRYRTRRTA